MKYLISIILMFIVFSAQAIELSKDQRAELIREANRLQQALQDNDDKTFIKMVFEPIIELVGGKETFSEVLQNTFALYQRPGFAIEKVTVGEPLEAISAEPFIVSFIPTTTVVKTPGSKNTVDGFIVAVLLENRKRWMFFDGAVTQADINLLYRVLPNLPLDVVLPTIRTQRIKSSDVYRAEGENFFKEDKFKLALDSYTLAIDVDPDPELFLIRSEVYRRTEGYTESIADASRAIELQPGFTMAYLQRGRVFFELRQYHEALLDFSEATKLAPKKFDGYFFRGLTYSMLDNCEKAIADYSKAIKINRGDALVYTRRAECYIREGKNKKALKDVKKSLKIDPSDRKSYLVLGQAQIASKKIAQGCSSFRTACTFANCIPSYMENEKQVCKNLVRDSATSSRYLPLVSMKVNNALAKGYDYLDVPNPDFIAAEKYFLNVDTKKWNGYELSQLYLGLGSAYLMQDKYQEAIGVYEKYVNTISVPESQVVDVGYTLAQLYLAVKDYRNAIQIFEYCISRIADVKPQKIFNLGQAYYGANHADEASVHINTAIEMKEKLEGKADEAWYKFQYSVYYALDDIPHTLSALQTLNAYYPSEENKKLIEKLNQQ